MLARHIPELRAHYQRKRDAMTHALTRTLADKVAWDPPRGGFFLWVRLDGALGAERLLPFARARGVIYVVGNAFFVDGTGQQFMRLSFSAPPPDRIDEGVARLAAAVSDALETTAGGLKPAR